MMISESVAIYAGGMLGVITELYVVPEKRSAGVTKMLIDAGASLGRRRSWDRTGGGTTALGSLAAISRRSFSLSGFTTFSV
jgi:hypothetical protein